MISKNNTSEIKAVTNNNNKNGENIKIVIGNVVSSEGIDLKNIREIHILDPWYHLNRLEQVIGRGIRYCSHNIDDVSELNKTDKVVYNYSQKNVTIYLYNSCINDSVESIDSYIYRKAEYKSKNIGEIELLLKQNAIDCSLFYSINILDNNIKNINLKTSQGTNIVNYKPIDIEYSKVCSFSKKSFNLK